MLTLSTDYCLLSTDYCLPEYSLSTVGGGDLRWSRGYQIARAANRHGIHLSTVLGPGKIKVMWVGCQLSLLGGRKPIATTQCDRRHAIKDCSAYAAKP